MTIRLAVLSDIHGNLPALEAVLEDIDRESVDGWILAGDYTAGPDAVECIQVQRSLNGWCITGNGEITLRRFDCGKTPLSWRTLHQFAVLRWDHSRLDRDTLDYLAGLPEQLRIEIDGAAPIRVFHGSPSSPFHGLHPDRKTDELEKTLAETDEAVLICGHTHVPWKYEQDGRLILNPGAVCCPLNGYVGAQYAILKWNGNNWKVKHHKLRYEIQQVSKQFEISGALASGGPLARSFLLSIQTGHDVSREFLNLARCLAAEAGSPANRPIPDSCWDSAEALFDWKGYET